MAVMERYFSRRRNMFNDFADTRTTMEKTIEILTGKGDSPFLQRVAAVAAAGTLSPLVGVVAAVGVGLAVKSVWDWLTD
jgi:hypothetical protein